ncbi:MAG TPA: DNA cytosine methyltransferase [Byssovorax sp.]
MAEGFRRAGLRFDAAFDWSADACDSYGENLGHRPTQMDVRDLLRLVRGGWSPGDVDLLVADPPCTPWSRAGKRRGLDDERDMLRATVALISLLRPRAYLIGNVPGLQDSTAWPVVQEVIGGLARDGYCVTDYMQLDAANYGVPQHRVRPFWFGHLRGPCIIWPAPTHGDPHALRRQPSLPGCDTLLPWVTCRDALTHLPAKDLGRPVRLRALKTGPGERKDRSPAQGHAPHEAGAPARTVGAASRGNETLRVHPRHPTSTPDSPSRTVTASDGAGAGAGGGRVLEGWPWDRPSTTVLADPRIPPPGHHGGSFLSAVGSTPRKKRDPSTRGPQWNRCSSADAPAPTVLTDTDAARTSSPKLEWPWPRPATTICGGINKISPAGEKSGFFGPQGERTGQFGPNAIVLSERAAAILQGFPETWKFAGKTKTSRWAQIGMAMPPPLAEAVARSILAQMRASAAEVA